MFDITKKKDKKAKAATDTDIKNEPDTVVSEAVNAWASVQTSLISNKCWLCDGGFRKGKIKKVFTVAHLLRFLDLHYSSAEDNKSELISENLRSCYDAFSILEGSVDNATKAIQDIECDTWMSGLICAKSEECAKEYLMIVPEGKVTSKTTQYKKGENEDCPPDCDCDNPWAYIKAALVDNPNSTREDIPVEGDQAIDK